MEMVLYQTKNRTYIEKMVSFVPETKKNDQYIIISYYDEIKPECSKFRVDSRFNLNIAKDW